MPKKRNRRKFVAKGALEEELREPHKSVELRAS
jgi:hypothetical protein